MKPNELCEKLKGQLFRENYRSYNCYTQGRIARIKHHGGDLYGLDIEDVTGKWLGFYALHGERLIKATKEWCPIDGNRGFEIIILDKGQKQEEDNCSPSDFGLAFNRTVLEVMLKDEGAQNASVLITIFCVLIPLVNKMPYKRQKRTYNATFCEECVKLFKKDKEYWNTLTDRGLKLYNQSKKYVSPTYVMGFIAFQVINFRIEEKALYDFFSLILGIKYSRDKYMRVVCRYIRENQKRFHRTPSQGTQKTIQNAWEYYYVNLYKHGH